MKLHISSYMSVCAGSVYHIYLGYHVHGSVCVYLWVECMHICAQVKGCGSGRGSMDVCAHPCVGNVPACALWGSLVHKSQRQQLADCVMTCL